MDGVDIRELYEVSKDLGDKILRKDAEAVKKLLHSDPILLNMKIYNGYGDSHTPLYHAVSANSQLIVDYILSLKPRLDIENILYISVDRRYYTMTQLLLRYAPSAPVSPGANNCWGRQVIPLVTAIQDKVPEDLIIQLLDYASEQLISEGLHMALQMGPRPELIEHLVKSITQTKYLNDSLHAAVKYRNLAIIRELIAKGADPGFIIDSIDCFDQAVCQSNNTAEYTELCNALNGR